MTYDRVNWQNEPSENTPLSAENLNKMDSAIKELSEMVVANPVEADTDELKKVEIEGTVYKIAGGHELVNASGSTMTQRSKMSFPDSHLTDDSGNNQTIVDIVKEVTTAQWNNATEEGLYYINDKPDSIITAEQVAYDENNSVGDILGGDTLKFEVGTFPITYNSVSGNVVGIKATNTSSNRYTIIGTELSSGVLGQGTFVYNSWNGVTERLDKKWTYLGDKTGTAEIDLPSTWNELLIQITSNNANLVTYHIYGTQTANYSNTSFGNYGTSFAVGQISRTKAKTTLVNWAGQDVTASAKMYVYYR